STHPHLHSFPTRRSSDLHQHFIDAERECEAILKAGAPQEAGSAEGTTGNVHKCVFPAYDQCIKASHVFNLMDARGVISVTERQRSEEHTSELQSRENLVC